MRVFQFLVLFIVSFSCNSNKTEQTEAVVQEFFATHEFDKREVFIKAMQDTVFVIDDSIQTILAEFLASKNQSHTIIKKPITTGVVKNSVAHMRSLPKHAAELSTQYLMGQQIKIIDTIDQDWLFVQGEDQYLGYMNKGGITTTVHSDYNAHQKVMVFANETLALDAQGQIVSDLVFGNKIAKTPNGYLLPDGRQVHVAQEALEKPNYTDSITNVMNQAFSLLGRPYLWGGTSTKAMDCSGFTRMAFLSINKPLRRDASLQVHQGVDVDLSIDKWNTGDLLFFGTLREDSSQRITHVAIHTEDGRFIHCSQRVRIESINPIHKDYNKQRAETLLRVKRLL